MSAPNPASVMRKSPPWMPIRSATTEELPCAMLPNGPACTSTGVFSSVCSRFGLSASRMITAIAPAPSMLLGGHRRRRRRCSRPRSGRAARACPRSERGQREDRHHLGGGGDVEAGLPRDAVHVAAQADDDVAQRPVVDVEHPAPGDVVQVEAGLVALVEMVVEQRREQVVRRGDRVEVAGEVQVQDLHRDDLAVAAAGRPALDAERRDPSTAAGWRPWPAGRCASWPGRGRPWWWSCPRRAGSG